VNTALFYYNFANDQQPLGVLEPAGNIVTQLFNVPGARTYGFELEGVWKPVEPLTLSLQYSYLNAHVTNMAGKCVQDSSDPFARLPGVSIAGCPATLNAGGITTGQPQNIVGAQLPESPPNKVSVNGQYKMTFDPGNLIFSVSYIWKDKTYDSIFNRPLALAPAYYTLNLRATFDDVKGRYTIIAFANNVTNTLGYDEVTQTRVAGGTACAAAGACASQIPTEVQATGLTAPLTFGVEFQYRFR
jgi:iron complex outermembrane receptor protein